MNLFGDDEEADRKRVRDSIDADLANVGRCVVPWPTATDDRAIKFACVRGAHHRGLHQNRAGTEFVGVACSAWNGTVRCMLPVDHPENHKSNGFGRPPVEWAYHEAFAMYGQRACLEKKDDRTCQRLFGHEGKHRPLPLGGNADEESWADSRYDDAPKPWKDDGLTGEGLRDRGMTAALAAQDDSDDGRWKVAAEKAIDELIVGGKQFSAIDLEAKVGKPARVNAIGSIFQKAARTGRIIKVGITKPVNASRHASHLLVWQRKPE